MAFEKSGKKWTNASLSFLSGAWQSRYLLPKSNLPGILDALEAHLVVDPEQTRALEQFGPRNTTISRMPIWWANNC